MQANLQNLNKNAITFSHGIYNNPSIRCILNNRLQYKPKLFTRNSIVIGWGLKENTTIAQKFAKKKKLQYVRLEDGFIRSVGLGIQNAPTFSIVADKAGIYYDSTRLSTLEIILQNYNFGENLELIAKAKQAIKLIINFNISKYNLYPVNNFDLEKKPDRKKKVLIVGQVANDLSIKYGHGNNFTTEEIINTVFRENPDADIYVKIHPDVLTGQKKSDLDLDKLKAKKRLTIISESVNPISFLKAFDMIYTKTSQMGFEALLLGKQVVCFGIPFYSGWGLTDDRVKCSRRTRQLKIEEIFAGAYILYSHYYNPYTEKKSDIIDTIYTVQKQRQINLNNSGKKFFFNFEHWKHHFIKYFFSSFLPSEIYFCREINDALKKGMDSNSKIYVWGKKNYDSLTDFSKNTGVPIYRVEDGFYRSLTLGCYKSKACSILIDEKDCHFDCSRESELEHILSNYDFKSYPELLTRAKRVKNFIEIYGISKYNSFRLEKLKIRRKGHDKVILIVGQVASDASIKYGGMGMTNRKLIVKVRKENPKAYIIYKPHPDVLTHLRNGYLPKKFLKKFCNIIIEKISIDSCIKAADEVHVISSMCGFEGLLRGKKVVTYGLPFYAGWGLTVDKRKIFRRQRSLSLLELIAGALILYPRYIHPQTDQICEIEAFLSEIERERNRYFGSISYRCYIELRKLIALIGIFFIALFKGNLLGIFKYFFKGEK